MTPGSISPPETADVFMREHRVLKTMDGCGGPLRAERLISKQEALAATAAEFENDEASSSSGLFSVEIIVTDEPPDLVLPCYLSFYPILVLILIASYNL